MTDKVYVVINPNNPEQADLWKDVILHDSNGNELTDSQGRIQAKRYVVRGSVGVSETAFNEYKAALNTELDTLEDTINDVAARPAGLRIISTLGELEPDDSALLPLAQAENEGIPYTTELENMNVSVLADLHVISSLDVLEPGESGLISLSNLLAAGVPYTNDVDLSGYATTGDLEDEVQGINTSLASYVLNTALTNRSLDLAVKNVRGTTVALSGTDIDCSSGSSFTKTISANTALTFSNASQDTVVTLVLTNGGSATVTYPSSVKWEGGTAPELTESGVDILNFYTYDSGTTWIGSAICDVKSST